MPTRDLTFQAGEPAPVPLALRSEAEVMGRWVGDRPVVSILCPTYQHGDFIEAALRGFLGQDTDFPFEIIVRDDASIDGTAQIVRDFAERYPNIIHAILEAKNRWPQVKALPVLTARARGEFIALCEGDDYWVSSLKLARQVNSLRARPDAVLSHHERVVIQGGIVTAEAALWPQYTRDWSASELGRGREPVTSSVVYRNVDRHDASIAQYITYEDNFLWLRLSRYGGAVFETGLTACAYRVHEGGLHSGASPSQRAVRASESWYWMSTWFAREGDHERAAYCATRSLSSIAHGLEGFGVGAYQVGWRALARAAIVKRMRNARNRLRPVVERLIEAVSVARMRSRRR